MKKTVKYITPEMVFQDEISECGLACICMLAASLGKTISLSELRKIYPASASGLSLDEIIKILNNLGIRAFPVNYAPDSLHDLPLPAILHYGGNHFIFASEKKGKYVRILNPASGEGIFHTAALSGQLSGFAVLLDSEQPSQEETSTPSRFLYRKACALTGLVLPNMKKLMSLNLFVMGLALLIPALFLLVLNGEMPAGSQNKHLFLFIAVTIAALISAYTELLMTRLNIRTANGVSIRYIPELFSSLLRKRLSFFEKRALADINHRFSSFNSALSGRASLLITLRTSLVVCLCAVIVMFWIHVLLGGMAVLVILLYGAVSLYFSQPRIALMRQMEEAISEKNDFFFETINGISTVKSALMYAERGRKFARKHAQALQIGNQLRILESKQTILYKLFSNIESIALLAISVTLFSRGELTIGGLFAFSLFKQIASGSATGFYMANIAYKEQKVVGTRAQTMMDYQEDPIITGVPTFSQSLVISQVDFSYAQSRPLYLRLYLAMRSGEKIAVIGSSGSGKSTLLKLLSGLYSPSSGRLTLDGQDTSWETLMALSFYQPQDDVLFHTSIVDNITLFGKNGDHNKARQFTSMLGLTPCIDALPHGWHTLISENNPLMSSGQRQRLLVARALCADKPLILMDEPTANLDKASARLVMKAIQKSDKTIMVVLHDQDLLHGFDRIIGMTEKGIVEPVSVTASGHSSPSDTLNPCEARTEQAS